jgi:hypothetical protein
MDLHAHPLPALAQLSSQHIKQSVYTSWFLALSKCEVKAFDYCQNVICDLSHLTVHFIQASVLGSQNYTPKGHIEFYLLKV